MKPKFERRGAAAWWVSAPVWLALAILSPLQASAAEAPLGVVIDRATFREPDQLILLVDTKGELPLGGLVRRLAAAGWLVVGVEPVADALEDAFRSAVLGAKASVEPEATS